MGPTGGVDVNVGYDFVVQFIVDVHSDVLDMHVEITLCCFLHVNIAMGQYVLL